MVVARSWLVLGLLAVCGSVMAVPPAPKAANPPVVSAAGPKNEQGLTASIVVNKDSYVLNAAQSGKAFRDQIDAAKNARGGMGGGRLPQPPAVDLILRVTNGSDKDVTLTYGGDESRIDLALEGPGAISADNNVAMTMDFKMGTPTTLKPGQTKDIKISSLAFGSRGISKYAYWTEAGEYTVTATLTYASGEKQETVTSGGAKVKVTKE